MVFEVSNKNKNAIDGAEKFLVTCDTTLDESKNGLVKTQFLNEAPGILFGRNDMLRSLIGHNTQFTNADLARMNLVSIGSVLLEQSKKLALGGFRNDKAKRN